MITNAKVNMTSVKAFDQAAVSARDYANKFDRGIACLDELLRMLDEMASKLRKSISDMQIAKEKLAARIKSIEEVIARLTAQINDLQDTLDKLKRELSATEKSITIADKAGISRIIPNPAYLDLKVRIATVEKEINMLRASLYSHRARLEHARSLGSQILAHRDAINGVVYSLEEKKHTCQRLKIEFENVKGSTFRKSAAAVENLQKIEQLITEYLKIKMIYETSTLTQGQTSSNGGINISVNINKTTIIQSSNMEPIYSDEQIKEHNIKFDNFNRVCEYDGYKYGGKYNLYEDRLNGTSADNTIFGRYEGVRGESKYIPSNRIAEGVKVLKILAQYGVDGIIYRNAEPAFEVCAVTILKIDDMSEFRYDYKAPGNFTQADIKCAALWNYEERDGKTDWTARDIANYREANGLTWHEKCDMETMVLVHRDINQYFKHYGGVSECRMRDSKAMDGGEFDE